MDGKELGKINSAWFGSMPDRPYLFGLDLDFSLSAGKSGIGSGGKYLVNIEWSENCKWTIEDRDKSLAKACVELKGLLDSAKVNFVHELVGLPVEVTVENNTFKDFRILTEVL